MKTIIDIADQDYQYCVDYISGKTNTLALNNVHRLIEAIADGTSLDENKISYAIDTMRKYQKIEQVLNDWREMGYNENDGLYMLISGVVKDGNVD